MDPAESAYRSEALGAFSHEIRTPLTAIKMVVELGRRAGDNGSVVLEPDIAGMLDESIENLTALADGFQQFSWFERGKVVMSRGLCSLGDAIEHAKTLPGENTALTVAGDVSVEGPWDPERLPECLAAIAEAVARCGGGSARMEIRATDAFATVETIAGTPGGHERPVNADLGFRFFTACVALEHAGAKVEIERRERYLRVSVTLPR